MDPETSESGEPIWRHEPREEHWTIPNMEDCSLEQIDKHIQTHVGKISMVFHEIASDLVHIDVHQVNPTPDRPYYTLITSGMSDLQMTAPETARDFRYAEVMLCLPSDWKMDSETWKADENYYWPMRLLKICARFPHEYKTWLGWGHTIPNGDPAEPYASNTELCCVFLGAPKTVSKDFWSLQIRPDKIIRFYALYPLYRGEMELKLRKGGEHMEELFEANKVSEIVSVNRPDLSARGWWKRW